MVKNLKFGQKIENLVKNRKFGQKSNILSKTRVYNFQTLNKVTDQRLREQEADWAADGLRDQRAAAEMYLKAGQSLKAIEALATLNSAERLIEVARKLDKGDRKGLQRCAELLGELGQTAACAEIFGKMGDWKSLIQLYAKSDQWDEAFALANRNPDLSPLCWTLRADWLAERDMFIEAQQAYHAAGKQEEALQVLSKLTTCAVTGSDVHLNVTFSPYN